MDRDADQHDRGSGVPRSGSDLPDEDYGFSGREGFEEGNYSSAYGRGTAGGRDNPSVSGLSGAGYDRGGTDLPSPDVVAGKPLRVDDESETRRRTMRGAPHGERQPAAAGRRRRPPR